MEEMEDIRFRGVSPEEVAQDVMEITGTSGPWKYHKGVKEALVDYLETGRKKKFNEIVG